MRIKNSTALALNRYCAQPCAPGGFLGIPPAHGRSVKFTVANVSHNNQLDYSLAYPKSCPVDGVHRRVIAKRADDLFGEELMEDVWRGIYQSRIIIADLTGRNPNVYYELGLAHTLGKRVILLTQDVNDIPADLKRYRFVTYQDNVDGFDQLDKGLDLSIKERINSPTNRFT